MLQSLSVDPAIENKRLVFRRRQLLTLQVETEHSRSLAFPVGVQVFKTAVNTLTNSRHVFFFLRLECLNEIRHHSDRDTTKSAHGIASLRSNKTNKEVGTGTTLLCYVISLWHILLFSSFVVALSLSLFQTRAICLTPSFAARYCCCHCVCVLFLNSLLLHHLSPSSRNGPHFMLYNAWPNFFHFSKPKYSKLVGAWWMSSKSCSPLLPFRVIFIPPIFHFSMFLLYIRRNTNFRYVHCPHIQMPAFPFRPNTTIQIVISFKLPGRLHGAHRPIPRTYNCWPCWRCTMQTASNLQSYMYKQFRIRTRNNLHFNLPLNWRRTICLYMWCCQWQCWICAPQHYMKQFNWKFSSANQYVVARIVSCGVLVVREQIIAPKTSFNLFHCSEQSIWFSALFQFAANASRGDTQSSWIVCSTKYIFSVNWSWHSFVKPNRIRQRCVDSKNESRLHWLVFIRK